MRLIDAENLLETINECELTFDGGVDINELNEIINKQPTVSQWIPCSERLPERSVEVLTCDSVGTIEARSLEASYDGMFYWESQEGECERLSDAIAWMPLPEPYKEA